MTAALGLKEVAENHRFDVAALEAYLQTHLDGYTEGARVQQFVAGQSNPTFLLTSAEHAWVLRKKPPGRLLPSAHQVEREYRIYRALADSAVPVPSVDLLCEDDSIIGTPFYVMEYVVGRVFPDARLPEVPLSDRRAIYLEMIRHLAALHSVDYAAKGLSDFGKPGNYFTRQIGRWSKQYLAAQTDDIAAMNQLIQWLPDHMPSDDTTTIVHGDFQLYNMIYDPERPICRAVLDWELSTLGHPLADLAYNCMKYHSREPGWGVLGAEGIPTEQEAIQEYCRLTGRDRIQDWSFYLAFSFFRIASIVQGVYQRGLQGNASSTQAVGMKGMISTAADTAWRIVQKGLGASY